jgi:hypothetical protein
MQPMRSHIMEWRGLSTYKLVIQLQIIVTWTPVTLLSTAPQL